MKVSDPVAVQAELKNYWGEVYSEKTCDVDRANKLLRIYVERNSHLFGFEDLVLPDYLYFLDVIGGLKDSASGRNGIPYSAYKAVNTLSAEIFANHTGYMSTQTKPSRLDIFNQNLIWFALKGVTRSSSN